MTVLDFSASLPKAESIKKQGHTGVMLYCSPARSSWMKAKQPPRSYLDSLTNNGIRFGFVWQFRGGDSTFANSDVSRGFSGGVEDAKAAQKYLDSVGCGGHPVYFAVDFDITLEQWNSTAVRYFHGVISVLGKQRVGIYGHSRAVHWAKEDGVVAEIDNGRVLGWVTKSWSAGATGSDYATLYQRQHNVSGPDGIQVDINDVYYSNWGWRFVTFTQKSLVPANYIKIKPNPSHRGDPLFLPDVLKAFGVPVKELPGWRNWGMGDFDKIWGVGVHHTGANNTSAEYIARNPGLGNGLSSQLHISRTPPFHVTICGAGIAFHMGRGSYPGLPTNNANPFMIGIEPQSNGTDPWPAEMLDIYYRTVAAILWYLGYNASRCISHWEYSMIAQGKWDPGAGDGVSGHVMDMNHFRSRVQHYISNPPFMEGIDDMANALDEQFKSRYTGSTYQGSLKDFIVNADAHAFASRVNTEKLLKIEEERLKLDKEKLENDKKLAQSLSELASAIRKDGI